MIRPSPAAVVGVLDWGVGGLDLLWRLRAQRPDLDCLYHSDSGAPPYGTLSANALARTVAAALASLIRRGATHLIVACNAASTVLHHPYIRNAVGDRPLIGVIAPTLRAIRAGVESSAVLGVIGGARTIRSGALARPLRAAGYAVRARIAQPLSAHIERGHLSGPAVEKDLDRILKPLRSIDRLVLACTHYPALAASIQGRLPGVDFIDPAACTLREVLHWDLMAGKGNLDIETRGDPDALVRSARIVFEIRGLPHVQRMGA